MMPDDTQRHSPTMSAYDGQRPTMADTDRPRPPLSAIRKETHTLTSLEGVKLFEHSNLPRSQRSIERYCKSGKLDCFFDEDEQRYYITPGSAERLIGQLKEIQARHERSGLVGMSAAPSDMIPPISPPDNHAEVRAEKTKEFEDKIFNLTVDNKAKEQVITQLKDQIRADREEFVSKLTHYSRQVGQLEMRLIQLEAPKRGTMHTAEASGEDVSAHDAEFTEVSPASQNTNEFHE